MEDIPQSLWSHTPARAGENGMNAARKSLMAIPIFIIQIKAKARPVQLPWSDDRYTTQKAVELIHAWLERPHHESQSGILVDEGHRILGAYPIAIGRYNCSETKPDDVFLLPRYAEIAHIVMVHNHPWGPLTPSVADHAFSKSMRRASRAYGVSILDELIVGHTQGEYFSFRERGLLRQTCHHEQGLGNISGG